MKTQLVLALSCLGLGAGCASSPDSTVTRTAVRYDDHIVAGVQAPERDIFIEDRVAAVCDIPKSSSFFAVGSAGTDEVDWQVVRRVADCMKDGPLSRENVVIIGYTDPRGSAEYNERLGLARAEAVAAALTSHGIANQRVFLKSYGESKAKDKQAEADMARDRKATLRVAEPR